MEELHKVVSPTEEWKKKVKIIKDEKQCRISIPGKFVDVLNLDVQKDFFEFHLIPDEDKKQGYRLEVDFVRG